MQVESRSLVVQTVRPAQAGTALREDVPVPNASASQRVWSAPDTIGRGRLIDLVV
jgi:hypothetical protein